MPYTPGGPYTVGGNFTNVNANNMEGGISGAYTQLESITGNDGVTQATTDGPFTLANLINFILKAFRNITGKANWYDVPDATIAQLNTNKANLSGATFTGTVNVSSGSLQQGGKNVCFAQSGLTGKRTASLTPPPSPADGDEWIDLSTVLG